MNIRAVIHVISLLLAVIGSCQMVSGVVGWIAGDAMTQVVSLTSCAASTLVVAALAYSGTRRQPGEQRFKTGPKDGYASVTLGWLCCTLAAALPFYFGANMMWCDALFESSSGLTTTGASVLSESLSLRDGSHLVGGLESLSKGLLFWRCLMNWLGGVGIVFFVLLILPWLKVGEGKQLYNAEVPGLKIAGDQMTPRLTESVKMVVYVYLGLTCMASVVYKLCGMTWYDAICHSFATVSTGGFSTKNESIAYYDSAILQWCVIFFMFVSACNFALTIRLFTQRKFVFFKDEEWRFFAMMALIAIVFVSCILYVKCPDGLPGIAHGQVYKRSIETYLRTTAFQVISVMSTTGFVTSDWNAWDFPCVLVVFMLLMFPCGCGGSTAGGMKYSRVIVIIKQLRYEIQHCVFMRSLPDVRLNGERIDSGLVGKTVAFVALYAVIFLTVALILSFQQEVGVKAAFSGALTCLDNVGPGYGKLGPTASFDWLSGFNKILLALTMIIGRLELYTVLVLFMPSFWRR